MEEENSQSQEMSPELEKEQAELVAKIENYGKDVVVKAGISGQIIDYAQYVGKRVKIATIEVGTKPQYWKDGKKSVTPIGIIPCFVVTTEPLDQIDNKDGTFRDIIVEARLNAYFVTDNEGKEILSFTKDNKGLVWKFCRRMGVDNPFDAVGMEVEIEQQLNKDPNDPKVWLQIRI